MQKSGWPSPEDRLWASFCKAAKFEGVASAFRPHASRPAPGAHVLLRKRGAMNKPRSHLHRACPGVCTLLAHLVSYLWRQ